MIAILDQYKCRCCQHKVLLAWGKKVCIKGNWEVNIFKGDSLERDLSEEERERKRKREI